MEDLSLSYCEHKILHYNQRKLESRHKVKILMPDFQKNDLCSTGEIIFVKIVGDRKDVESVQQFLKLKLESMEGADREDIDQSVIELNSDSEGDSGNETILSESTSYKRKSKKPRLDFFGIDLVPNNSVAENPSQTCEVTSTTNADESVIVLNTSVGDVQICTNPLNEEPLCSETSVQVVEEVVVLSPDEVPICTNSQSEEPLSLETSIQVVEEVVILSSDEENTMDQIEQGQIIPRPISTRVLRPIVIDGSNVARLHGKPQNTFSCKGIKVCVDYFLKKGHTQVTAFVPLFRKHCKKNKILTTDQHVLEELHETQHVVFTPSRRIDGLQFACYDDRFIVELAAANGGVILSNDNYKDLLNESPAFTETIKNRLLMYCFVGDFLMIPDDPMGRGGPKLDEFLSFPPSVIVL